MGWIIGLIVLAIAGYVVYRMWPTQVQAVEADVYSDYKSVSNVVVKDFDSVKSKF